MPVEKMAVQDYPGLGLDLRFVSKDNRGFHPIGAHGSCRASKSDVLPVRELAMMSIMDRLTDKPDWHKKVFDEEIISKWRMEAMLIPDEQFHILATRGKYSYRVREGNAQLGDPNLPVLKGVMTENSFNCCIEELKSKAKYFEESSLIPTLDASATVVKSDNLVPTKLSDALSQAFHKLKLDQQSSPDWHPNSGEMVQDLVHPSMFPLVYGFSKVLKEEVVGVNDAIRRWAGKGELIPKVEVAVPNRRFGMGDFGVGGEKVPPQYWSDTYQWLPANLAFQEDGKVKFTSYINNLHPNKYSGIYAAIESLVDIAIPAWDQCLTPAKGYDAKEGAGRFTSRFSLQDNPDDENPANWTPSDPQEVASIEIDWDQTGQNRVEYDPEWDDETQKKWELLREPVIPEPSFVDVDYTPPTGSCLRERFATSGLQIIVKLASIELTPEKPEFPVGGWHIEGQMNEHICATALYYLDSENITDSNLSFRMQTNAYLSDDVSVGQDSYHWLEQIWGTRLGHGAACLQNYGSVDTHQGRLLAFPNVFQHQVSPFRLQDPTKPGHRRFIALWLVDPFQRIISTANVPPQQMDWWLDSVLGDTPESRKEALSKLPAELVMLMKEKGLDAEILSDAQLPEELMALTTEYFNADGEGLPMSLEEAKEHRIKLMAERSAFVKTADDGYHQHSYSFCEH